MKVVSLISIAHELLLFQYRIFLQQEMWEEPPTRFVNFNSNSCYLVSASLCGFNMSES